MKKLSVAFLTLFLTALCASCAFSMILRSPDPLGKGLSEVSADMQNVQYGSTDRSMVGIGYEYGMTDRFGAKIGLEDDSVTNR